MRPDLDIITRWIQPGSKVLDLGCGDGTLLQYLQENHQATGYGLEIDPDNIAKCISA
ncbi:MAG: methyltransferase domain-containing protein, partial [Gammaproteobacteria bacterium]|nr:methyltransferase domain-containing protein [Gammaproteobacteria bacterium]